MLILVLEVVTIMFCFRNKVIGCFFRLIYPMMIESEELHLLLHGILAHRDRITCSPLEAH